MNEIEKILTIIMIFCYACSLTIICGPYIINIINNYIKFLNHKTILQSLIEDEKEIINLRFKKFAKDYNEINNKLFLAEEIKNNYTNKQK